MTGMYVFLAFILGVAMTIYTYESIREKETEKIGILLSKRMEKLLEEATLRISRKQKKIRKNSNRR